MDIKYAHIRDRQSPRGGATLAMQVDNDMVVNFASALCHPKDNFCRATGRLKAAAKLNAARVVGNPMPFPMPIKAVIDAARENIHRERNRQTEAAVQHAFEKTIKRLVRQGHDVRMMQVAQL